MGGSGSYQKPADVPSKHFPALRERLPRMDGKTVAVTGCTTGTGFICARVCAELGARVVMLNRPSSRAESALAALKEAVPNADVRLVPCDLLNFASVREAGARLRAELPDGLDVLCNNAGIMALKDEATVDGCDVQMQTNHLSHFLLTAEVWPLLEKAAEARGEARVVNHSSMARNHGADGKKPLDAKYLGRNGGNLGGDACGWKPFGLGSPRWTRYQQTKLANVVFTYALRDRLKAVNSKIKAVVAHPGLAATNLQVTTAKDGGMGERLSNVLMNKMSQSAEDGAMGIVQCCCDPAVNSGDFYGPRKATGPSVLLPPEPEEKFADEASRKMLWDVSCEVTGAKFPF